MPTAVHQPRKLTLFCWILDLSDRSFHVDIEDNLTVDHLKDAIVKKNPVSFEDVDSDELHLWKVSGFPPFSTYPDYFSTRHPFRLTTNSGTKLAINSFLNMKCCWRQPDCRRFFHHLVPLRKHFTSLYDIRVLVSHLFDTSEIPLIKCHPASFPCPCRVNVSLCAACIPKVNFYSTLIFSC